MLNLFNESERCPDCKSIPCLCMDEFKVWYDAGYHNYELFAIISAFNAEDALKRAEKIKEWKGYSLVVSDERP